ncbi:MAG: hypothetical protein K2F73_03200, partial [Ruminococcus sp.]|nr:hypothetical protein [Ruminococcus sp.]
MFVVFSTGCYGLGLEVKKFVTGKEDFGQTFAYWCQYGNIELIEEFIENKKISQSTLNSGLYNARQSEIRKILLDAGADPNYRDMLDEYAYNDNPALFDIVDAEGLDINKRSVKSNLSALSTAPRNVRNDDKNAYLMCERMLENGAELYPEMFDYKEGLPLTCPQTVKMLANRYIDEGGKFDYPDTYVYALCGDISNAVKSAEKDKNELDEHEKYQVFRFASLFGTVEEYKKLKEIFNMEDDTRYNYEELTVSCSIEMLEYLLEVNGEDIKFDPGIDDADDFKSFDYEDVSDGFTVAISRGRYDMCKYYIDHGVKPNSSLTNYPPLTAAINCGDYELFRLVYDYIKEEYGNPDEEVFGWCFSLHYVNDCTKKIMDFLLDEGYTFEKAHYNWISDSVGEYLISHGAVITDEIVKTIGQYNYKNSLKAVIDRGYEISPKVLTNMIQYASSDMIEMVLDSGTEMEDNIMPKCNLASRATTKLLIERGANLNPTFVKDGEQYGSYDGDPENFNLKRFYEKYCR